MSRDYDAIVVGAGHNGLTAAARLASEGARTLVLEARDEVGGLCGSVRLPSGAVFDLAAEDLGLYRADLVDRLALESAGLVLEDAEAFLCALDGGGRRSRVLWRDAGRTEEELGKRSQPRIGRFRDLLRYLEGLGGELEQLLRRPPRLEDLGMLLRTPELLRAISSSSAELAAEWFDDPLLQGAISTLGTFGASQGPRSQGTGLLLLYQLSGTTALGLRPVRRARGGAAALCQALANVVQARGGVVRTGTPVSRVSIHEGRAVAVQLEGGEEISAEVILSGLDARRTLLRLVGADRLPVATLRRLRAFKYRGVTSRLLLLLDGSPPPPPGVDPEALSGRALVAPSIEAVERAFDAAKYGRCSQPPVLDVKLSAVTNTGTNSGTDSGAGDGEVRITVNARCSPYRLREGGWEEQRDAWSESILATLERAWPGVRERVLEQQLLTPADLRERLGVSEGSGSQGEMLLGQMFVMRSVSGLGGCETPVEALLLCGSGAHPGGGVTGVPGALAASQALELLGAGKAGAR